MAKRLAFRGVLTLDGTEHRGRVTASAGLLRVTQVPGKQVLVEAPFSTFDRLDRRNWSITLEDGRVAQAKSEGCGCRGGG